MRKIIKIVGIGLIGIMVFGVVNKLKVPTPPPLVVSIPGNGIKKFISSRKPIGRTDYISLARALRPMRALGGRRYCSSSVINHRGRRYTVTNRHCCKTELQDGMIEGYRQVGDTIEKILFVSQISDLCVLKTNHKYGLNIAKKAITQFEKTIILGYPHGSPLTVYEGRFQYSEKTCINYTKSLFMLPDVRCVDSNVHSTKSYPGNSGSPMFNRFGDVIGILYAGSSKDSITTKLKQLNIALDSARALERRAHYGKNR